MSDGADTPVPTGSKQASTQFKPGQSGNPKGRPKGSRSKLGEDFVSDALEAWKKNGPTALQTMASEDPSKFCQMIAGILPKELNVNTTPAEELSDDELASLLATVKSLVSAATSQNVGEGSDTETKH